MKALSLALSVASVMALAVGCGKEADRRHALDSVAKAISDFAAREKGSFFEFGKPARMRFIEGTWMVILPREDAPGKPQSFQAMEDESITQAKAEALIEELFKADPTLRGDRDGWGRMCVQKTEEGKYRPFAAIEHVIRSTGEKSILLLREGVLARRGSESGLAHIVTAGEPGSGEKVITLEIMVVKWFR